MHSFHLFHFFSIFTSSSSHNQLYGPRLKSVPTSSPTGFVVHTFCCMWRCWKISISLSQTIINQAIASNLIIVQESGSKNNNNLNYNWPCRPITMIILQPHTVIMFPIMIRPEKTQYTKKPSKFKCKVKANYVFHWFP